MRELRAGRAPTDFKLDLGAPAMKKLLAESLAHAHALLAQQPEKMLKYWKPLEVAFDREYQDAITLVEEIERIFRLQAGVHP